MKILFVNQRASALGGVEANVRDTARELAGRGHDVALAHEHPARDADFRATFPAFFPMGRRPAAGLARASSIFRPDVIYLHKVEDASVLGTETLPAPTVRMIHDHDLYCQRRHRYLLRTHRICTRPAGLVGCLRCGGFVERRRGNPLGLGWRPITSRLNDLGATRRMARVLVASRYMALELHRNRVSPDLVRVVPLGVPETPPPPERNGRQGPTRLLYVGQVLRSKGVDLLLEALARCPAPWHLTVVGTGAQEPEFRALATARGLEQRVDWRGRLATGEVAAAFAEADVALVPSRWPEPFGLVGLEAMRAALPTVAFANGGISDWLDDGRTGLLAAPCDVAALARAIERLCRDAPLRRAMGARALETYRSRFTLNRYVDRLEEALEEAASCT